MTPRYDETVLLFAGSFNPFTKGHLRIVERALGVAAGVIVAIGTNPEKKDSADTLSRAAYIRRALATLPQEMAERTVVCTYSGLTVEFARSVGATALLRGVRDVKDFEYERNLADINLKVLGMDTVLLCAEPEYSFISSSTVRELSSHGHDVSSFLPL